jgi:hypothetical protein
MTSAKALKRLMQPPVIGDPIFGHLKPIAGGIFNCLANKVDYHGSQPTDFTYISSTRDPCNRFSQVSSGYP